jgi:hypothetical protein
MDAIFAPSVQVEGSVFLDNYPYDEGVTSLIVEGSLFFASARIAHDCFITNTAVSLASGRIDTGYFAATEEHGRDVALSLARAQVGGNGIVSLAGATVARHKDEPAAPGANYPICLDGFKYGDFSRHTETSVKARLDWLERRPTDTPFTAQAYEQLAKVLIALGHRDDARTVLLVKERLS